MTSISTLSLLSPIRTSVAQNQAALTQAQTEISSGAPADLGLTIGARTGTALSLRSEVDSLSTYSSSNAVATTRLAATSNALDTMLSSAQGIQSTLSTASTAGGSTSGLQASAQGALQSLIGGLNTTVAGQAVFGGINTGETPIPDATSTATKVSAVYQSYLSNNNIDPSAMTAIQMNDFLSSSAFTSLFTGSSWSQASSQSISSTIAPGQTATTSVSANQGTFQGLAKAYTMLGTFVGSNLSSAAQATVVSTAQSLMNTGVSSLTDVQTGVGVAQSTITAANTQISAQVDVLKTNVSDLTSVDTYALSSQVTALQTQLEASYELTNKLQSLSLVNYLST